MNISISELKSELVYKTSRSSGKGGQNVNKVSTKVALIFDFKKSALLSETQKQLIEAKVLSHLNKDGAIHLTCEESRSQFMNKEKAIAKLIHLLEKSIHRDKPRKATKPKKSSIEKRLKDKKIQSERKTNRSTNF